MVLIWPGMEPTVSANAVPLQVLHPVCSKAECKVTEVKVVDRPGSSPPVTDLLVNVHLFISCNHRCSLTLTKCFCCLTLTIPGGAPPVTKLNLESASLIHYY